MNRRSGSSVIITMRALNNNCFINSYRDIQAQQNLKLKSNVSTFKYFI